jgi:hypothetical protein
MTDFQIIMQDLSQPGPRDPKHDLNEDGSVDIADARFLVLRFTNPKGAPCL